MYAKEGNLHSSQKMPLTFTTGQEDNHHNNSKNQETHLAVGV